MRAFSGRLRGLVRDEGGSPVVSFALMAPVLLIMTIGILDLGRALWTHSTISHATREAARYASIHGAAADTTASADDIASVAIAAATGMGVTTDDVTVAWSPDNQPGGTVTVRIALQYDFLVGGFLSLSPAELTATSRRTVF